MLIYTASELEKAKAIVAAEAAKKKEEPPVIVYGAWVAWRESSENDECGDAIQLWGTPYITKNQAPRSYRLVFQETKTLSEARQILVNMRKNHHSLLYEHLQNARNRVTVLQRAWEELNNTLEDDIKKINSLEPEDCHG